MSKKYKEIFNNKNSVDEFRKPHTRIQTATAKTETSNTAVYSDTSVNSNGRTIRYRTTSQTVTHEQHALVTEINTSFCTANIKDVEELFPELAQRVLTFETPGSTQNRKFPSILRTEETTVTQNRGQNVTSSVQEQRIKLNKTNLKDDFYKNSFNINLNAPKGKTDTKTFNIQRPIGTKIDARPFATKKVPSDFETNALKSIKSGSSLNSSLGSEVPGIPLRTKLENYPFGTRVAKSASTPALQKPLGALPKTSMATNATKLKPGFAFIFNNENFDDSKNVSRVGTDADSENLFRTLTKLKLHVEVHKDATLAKIKSVVKTITNKDFKKHSCLVIAILTHGSRNEMVQARDKSYSIDDDILFPIMKNQSLNNKPKILFIQACKGYMEVEDFHKDKPQLNGTPSEILKCYSTFEGYVSYRTEQGTFFIQKLCEELQKNGETRSIQEIMRAVTAAVKLFTNGKQIPTMTVNLTEDFVFGDYM